MVIEQPDELLARNAIEFSEAAGDQDSPLRQNQHAVNNRVGPGSCVEARIDLTSGTKANQAVPVTDLGPAGREHFTV